MGKNHTYINAETLSHTILHVYVTQHDVKTPPELLDLCWRHLIHLVCLEGTVWSETDRIYILHIDDVEFLP